MQMILRHSSIYFVARVSAAVLNLLTTALLTYLLTPAQYGKYALVMAGIGFLSNVFFGWLGASIIRYFSDERCSPNTIATAVISGWFMLNSLLSLIVAGAVWLLGVVASEWRYLVGWGIALLWAQTWYDLCLETHRSQLAPKKYALMLFTRSFTGLVISISLVRSGLGAAGALIGAFLGTAGATLLFKPANLRFYPQGFQISLLHELARYGLPLSLNSAFLMVVHFSDRFMVAYFLGESAAGIYAAAYDLSQQSVALVLRSVANATHPLIFRAVEQQKVRETQNYLKRNFQILSFVGLFIVALLSGIAPELCRVVLGGEFREQAASLIPVISIATFVVGLRTHHFLLPFLIQRATQSIVAPSIVAAIANLGLNLWWIPSLGVQGAAWATLIAYVLALGIVIWLGQFVLKLPSAWQDLLKMSGAGIIAFLAMHAISSSHWIGLMFKILVGVIVYAGVAGILYWHSWQVWVPRGKR